MKINHLRITSIPAQGFFLALLLLSHVSIAQLSYFNMPNPDMFPDVGYSYVEYDQYISVKGNENVNANVLRGMIQPLRFLEVGTNLWFNKELDTNPDKLVISTKWRIWLRQNEKIKLSLSPGSWSSFYFQKDIAIKNIVYTFAGLTVNHSDVIYTRLMLGGYAKHWKESVELGQDEWQSGLMAGIEQRLSKKFVFVTDYFQGSGEGFGLATGFVYYAINNGSNLPIYLAYQFDNDSRANDAMIFEIGYFFKAYTPRRSAK